MGIHKINQYKIKRIISLLIGIVGLWLFAVFSVSANPVEVAPASLTIAYSPYRPFIFQGKDHQPRGILKDLWDLWSQKNNIPVSFVRHTRQSAREAVVQGRADVLALMDASAMKSSLHGIGLPLDQLSFLLHTRTDLPHPVTSILDLIDIAFGAVAADSASAYIKEQLPSLSITLYEDHESLVKATMANEVQAFVMAGPVASTYIARHKGAGTIVPLENPLYHLPVQAGVKIGNDRLIKTIEAGFHGIGNREIQEVVTNWTGKPQAVVLGPHIQKLRIASSIDNMPFHFADDQGKAVGMFVDLWKLWSQKTGVEIEFIPLPWAQSLDMVKSGQADIHAGCFFSAQRDTFLDYAGELRDCQTHFFFHESIYGLKNIQDLKGFEIGVLDQDYAVEFVRREMPGAALKIYNSHKELFQGVEAGEVKVFICDTPTALYFLTRKRLISSFRYHPSRPLYRKPFFAAVREGNTPLINKINQGLAAITTEERASIERQWMGKAPVNNQNHLIIGLDQSFPPFSMRAANGEPSGLLKEFWTAWSKKTGRSIAIRLYDRQAAVHALKDGTIDILSIPPPKEPTSGWVGFSPPHYRFDWYIYQGRLESSWEPGDIFSDFSGPVLGALNHSPVFEHIVNQNQDNWVIGFDTTEQMIIAAGEGQINGFLATPQEMAVLPGQLGLAGGFVRGQAPYFTTSLRAGVRNYNPALINLIDSGFEGISQGEMAVIEKNWIPEADLRVFSRGNYGIQLSGAEEKWLASHRLEGLPIRLGIDPQWPPFEFMEKDGQYQGMVSEVVDLLSKKLGLSIDLIPDPDAPGVDVVPSAFSFEKKRSGMAYTSPYLNFPWVIITKAQAPLLTGLIDMNGQTLACDIRYEPMMKLNQNWPGIHLLQVSSTQEGLEAVLSGKAQGYLGNQALAGYQIHINNDTSLKVAAATGIEAEGLVFAVRKDWPELVSMLNKGLASISSQELDQIRQKWFSMRFDHGADLVYIKGLAMKTAVGVLLAFGLVLFWNRLIRRREERFKCLTEHGSDIIQAFSPDGRLVYASPSHTTVLGYNLKVIKGKTVFDLIHPEDISDFKQMLNDLGKTRGTTTIVYRMIHCKGYELFFESHCMDLTDNKALKSFVINGRDITDPLKIRKEMEFAKESAEAANQSKTDFLAGLSHEVRTPLNAILGMTEMTLKTRLNTHQNKNLAAVLSAARHLKEVISDILDFSTIEAGKMKIHEKEFNLSSFLDILEHTWRIESEKKGLEFDLVISGSLPSRVGSDPVRLGQILTNLLSNALKFTQTGGISIHVTAADPPGETNGSATNGSVFLSFEVRDTGIGIDPDQKDRIFQRFAQARGSVIREYKGTGLGLSISREIALLMGGSIGVESRPGHGSCFTLGLPFTIVPDDSCRSISRPDPVFVGNLTLLLVEDDPVNQKVFKEMLQEFNCRVLCAKDGEKALESLGSQTIDMVFMDIEMPIMDGLTASRYIRDGRAGKDNCNVPIIAMTAHVLDQYRTKARDAGMDGFIAKPIERDELVDVLFRYQALSIDREKALASLGGNRELLEKVFGIFVTQTPELLQSLSLALDAGDKEAIGLAAHTLKGAGARVYAQKASALAARLESMAADPSYDIDEIQGVARDTLRQFKNVIGWLEVGKSS